MKSMVQFNMIFFFILFYILCVCVFKSIANLKALLTSAIMFIFNLYHNQKAEFLRMSIHNNEK